LTLKFKLIDSFSNLMAVVNVSGCKRTDRRKQNNNRQAKTITYRPLTSPIIADTL